jgi:hypothetical protein
MTSKFLKTSVVALSLVGMATTVRAQYPKIPAPVQQWSDSLLEAARKHSDSAWAVAYPIIDAEARN